MANVKLVYVELDSVDSPEIKSGSSSLACLVTQGRLSGIHVNKLTEGVPAVSQ